jgi:hypothetical protein
MVTEQTPLSRRDIRQPKRFLRLILGAPESLGVSPLQQLLVQCQTWDMDPTLSVPHSCTNSCVTWWQGKVVEFPDDRVGLLLVWNRLLVRWMDDPLQESAAN